VELHEGDAEGEEGSCVGAGSPRQVLPQRHHREEGDDADGDDPGVQSAQADVAEDDAFVLPLDDGEQYDRGAARAQSSSRNALNSTGVSEPEARTSSAWWRIGAYRKAAGTAGTWVRRESTPAALARFLLGAMGLAPVLSFPAPLLECGVAELGASPVRQGFRGLRSPLRPERMSHRLDLPKKVSFDLFAEAVEPHTLATARLVGKCTKISTP
jgi:hypothetical protein